MEEEPVLSKEHLDAIQGLTDIIGNHPHAYNALAKSYGAPVETDHEAQVSQAIFLLHTHPDFEQRFDKEVASVRGFDIGKIFKGIVSAFKVIGKIFGPIVNAIKKAVQKHKAAKAAAAAKGKVSAPPPAPKSKAGMYAAIIGVTLLFVGVVCVVLFGGDSKKTT